VLYLVVRVLLGDGSKPEGMLQNRRRACRMFPMNDPLFTN